MSASRKENPKRMLIEDAFIARGENPRIKNEAVLCAKPFRDSDECLLFEHTAFKAALPPQPDK